ncbi:Carboxyvinyl-carboxyphosphonate phosphorylmutase [Pseudovibrio axinellae]|uniref:Carboxyvinyl-carboxyphosphonate phosphorylmutase n=1 Tax=Pseudovibrio axinellae TaxID=989403 RepID=A0A165YAT2_9HYPH|nr:isocitrate lyase/phosphoenolpyruvate mutase family protein [Pseudovibrio axinellae]KZL18621.1 Carboxyvinyl-carboxyphosphonate phosphorylmutase [Pseudovibrio axinellae]SER74201.1 2-Methylisocitrate lyase, PEP mutase family [Pseudovibrio axinellae]
MSQLEMAKRFAKLHVKGEPLVLYNIWDAATARAVAKAGAKALATGSASVAIAHGYDDGEHIPLELVETIASRIVANIDLPFSLDFEGAYASEPVGVKANAARIIKTGAVGVNFEDQKVNGSGLYSCDEQCKRIAAFREAADEAGVPFFINARTDLFLQEADASKHSDLVEEAISRGQRYGEAGASGFFMPALADTHMIEKICRNVPLPVNAYMKQGMPEISELAKLGVARVSYGPTPFFKSMKELELSARAIY